MSTQRRERLGVALIGAGAFGARRAAAVAADPRSALVVIADPVADRAASLAKTCEAACLTSWRAAIERDDIQIVIVSTPPSSAPEISFAALLAGKHVFVEKPFGRNADEILPAVQRAREKGLLLKVGYNHRYHPSLAKAHEIFLSGAIGRLLHLRCVYGHGGRPGYEQEWRSRFEVSGGGELLDQGVHAIDLFRWFAGEFAEAAAFLATSHWPIAPVEDNVFALLRTCDGTIAQLHASWTQWKNSFSFEVAGESGTLVASGLGRSYGPEQLIWHTRASAGGPPAEKRMDFPGEDDSLACEWNDFLDAVEKHREPMSSGVDARRTLEIVDALYRSAREHCIVQLQPVAEPIAAVAAQARDL